MPPWGAVKGFGDFRNDQALTPEQLELIISWVGGGVPEGEAKDLRSDPKIRPTRYPEVPSHGVIAVSGELQLRKRFLAGRTAAEDRSRRRGFSNHRRTARRQHRTAAMVRTLQREVRPSVPVSSPDRSAGRHEDSWSSARIHRAAAPGPRGEHESYSSSLTGTSKCAVFTTPLRWNCTHTR